LVKKPLFSGQKADLFALGVILFCMVTGRPPFEEAEDQWYKGLIREFNGAYWRTFKNRSFSSEFKCLVK